MANPETKDTTTEQNPDCETALGCREDCGGYWGPAGPRRWCGSCAAFYEVIVRPRRSAAAVTRRVELPSGLIAIYSPEDGWLLERPDGTEVQHQIQHQIRSMVEMVDVLTEHCAKGLFGPDGPGNPLLRFRNVALRAGLSVGRDLAAIYDLGSPETPAGRDSSDADPNGWEGCHCRACGASGEELDDPCVHRDRGGRHEIYHGARLAEDVP